MSNYSKKDFMALQNAWNICLSRYLASQTLEARLNIIDDWRDSLIDVKLITVGDGKKALRSRYEQWEEKTWLRDCKLELAKWKIKNPFESKDKDEVKREFNDIKMERNYIRFRKIMQVIQDSGIGLGVGRERDQYDVSGFMGETTE